MHYNTVNMITACLVAVCFTVMAIFFGKWWIGLFIILCLMTPTTKKEEPKK